MAEKSAVAEGGEVVDDVTLPQPLRSAEREARALEEGSGEALVEREESGEAEMDAQGEAEREAAVETVARAVNVPGVCEGAAPVGVGAVLLVRAPMLGVEGGEGEAGAPVGLKGVLPVAPPLIVAPIAAPDEGVLHGEDEGCAGVAVTGGERESEGEQEDVRERVSEPEVLPPAPAESELHALPLRTAEPVTAAAVREGAPLPLGEAVARGVPVESKPVEEGAPEAEAEGVGLRVAEGVELAEVLPEGAPLPQALPVAANASEAVAGEGEDVA